MLILVRHQFLTCLILAFQLTFQSCSTVKSSESSQILVGQEPYSSRPSIYNIHAVEQNVGGNWEYAKKAQLEAAALLSGLYNDFEIYILARDGEYIYDFLKLVDKKPERFHLMNISRANQHDPLLAEYMAQEGLSAGAIAQGRKFLIFDTGQVGQIFETIKSKFNMHQQSALKFQMITSANQNYPSMRSFLSQYDANAASSIPNNLHHLIKAYEYQPHFTRRSTAFAKQGGVIEPIVTQQSPNDTADPNKAKQYMQDLKAFADKDSVKKRYYERVEMWTALRTTMASGDGVAVANLCQDLINYYAHSTDLDLIRAAIADLVEIQQKNRIEPVKLQFSLNNVYNPSAASKSKPFGKNAPTSSLDSSSKSKESEIVDIKDVKLTTLKLSSNEKFRANGSEYKVINEMSRDNDFAVYEIVDKAGDRFVIKFATSGSSKESKDLVDEEKAAERIRKVNKAHAVEIVESDEGFVIKKYVDGVSGADWLKQWSQAGFPENTAVKQFREMIRELADSGLYVGGLTPSDTILTKNGWVIINSGSAEKMETVVAYQRYREKILSRWSRELGNKAGVQGCDLLVKGFNG